MRWPQIAQAAAAPAGVSRWGCIAGERGVAGVGCCVGAGAGQVAAVVDYM